MMNVNSFNFDDQVLHSQTPVLLDVSAPWCAPCKAAEPVLERLAEEHTGHLHVLKLDAQEAPDVAARLGVRGFPTFVLFAGGREIGRLAGFPGERGLRRFAAQATKSDTATAPSL